MKQLLLIAKAIHGDRTALETLVKQYYHCIYNYIIQRVKVKEIAEDLTQDVFVKLTINITSYRPIASFSAFLYRIAHNTVIDYYRTSKITEELSEDITVDKRDELTYSDEKMMVQAMLDSLKPEQRECILLYYFHNLTYVEIAQVLDIPIPTAKSRVRRGLEVCRKWMEGKE